MSPNRIYFSGLKWWLNPRQIEGQTGWHRFLLWETTTPAGKEVELHLDDHHEVSPSPPKLGHFPPGCGSCDICLGQYDRGSGEGPIAWRRGRWKHPNRSELHHVRTTFGFYGKDCLDTWSTGSEGGLYTVMEINGIKCTTSQWNRIEYTLW